MTHPQKQQVLLLHGILRTHRSMAGIARRLEREGYAVYNIGYPSTRMQPDALVEYCHGRLTEHYDPARPLHIVGYSMGCLIARALIHRHRPPSLGRVVMIAPPNHGSEAADWWQQWWVYRTLYGVAGMELGTGEQAFWRSLPQSADYELGIIAGTKAIDPICNHVLPGEHDSKVTVESTKLPGMKAHITVPFSHTFIIHQAKVAEQVVKFLKEGCFEG